VDIVLEGEINGVEGIEILKEKYPSLIIVVVTSFENDESVFNCLRAGALGYLTKSQNYIEIVRALDEIENGGAPMSSKIARLVVNNFHKNPNSPLTTRETQILHNLSAGKSYSQIASELNISRETSKTHIRNIYQKLSVHSKFKALEKAKKESYI
jgi:DNA-binding NarL/FixJ family response regulator